ncbi:MAG: GTP-binding protein gtr1 [Alectoria fallacina]|uniref:GTP-binding protein n=1 Tax=Alectoria fallacina TaxID=1903189 RepID=A0A8H3PJN5_9LECA|nr:MAG: GTP-binding protein gtr1 [Alectoria fallacina]
MNNLKKPQKKKVLLMGKSGSGKSSMRSIIFSNYVAKDVRRLGATIDVEHSTVKFLGSLILNLWDCGGQDAFTETYLTSQKSQTFSDVGVLIYVFDVESRSFEGSNPRDLLTYTAVVSALAEYSPSAHVFALVHKMDLVQNVFRDQVIQDRTLAIQEYSGVFGKRLKVYGTTIWDQSLYKAWGDIVKSLVPNLHIIDGYLHDLAKETSAEEIILFERATFLTVTNVTSELGECNPYSDRQERLSNVIKTFKHSLSKYTHSSTASHPFTEIAIKAPRFNLILARLTNNTYVLVILPPGDLEIELSRFNIMAAKDRFVELDIMGWAARDTEKLEGKSNGRIKDGR